MVTCHSFIRPRRADESDCLITRSWQNCSLPQRLMQPAHEAELALLRRCGQPVTVGAAAAGLHAHAAVAAGLGDLWGGAARCCRLYARSKATGGHRHDR